MALAVSYTNESMQSQVTVNVDYELSLLYLVHRVWRDKNKGERKIPPAFARPFSVARPVFASHSLVTLVLDGLSEMAIVFMPKLAGLLKMLPSFWSLIKQRMRLYTFSLPVPSESWEGLKRIWDTTVSKLTREKNPWQPLFRRLSNAEKSKGMARLKLYADVPWT